MKITDTSRVNAATTPAVRKTGGGDAAAFGRLLDAANQARSAAAAAGAAPVAGLDALLALQQADPEAERRSKARRRGLSLLDRLDDLRLALMGGVMSDGVLDRLAAELADRSEPVADPALAALLEDIDLRVQVELAKRGRLPPV